MLTSFNQQDLRGGQRGVVLIAVLWGLTLLALVAGQLIASARGEANLVYNQKQAARAQALAEAGIMRAVAGLLVPVEAGGFRADGSRYAWALGDGVLRFEIRDEGGKVDINTAEPSLLASLLVALAVPAGDAASLAAAIVDFRDSDSLRSISGAEDGDYHLAGRDFGAKDAPFENLIELRQVLGMTDTLFTKIEPLATVHSGRARPIEILASPIVAQILGQTVNTAASTPPIPSEDLVSAEPSTTPRPYSLGRTPARSGAGVYGIHVEARLPEGSMAILETVVRLAPGSLPPYRVLAWQRGRQRLFPREPVGRTRLSAVSTLSAP